MTRSTLSPDSARSPSPASSSPACAGSAGRPRSGDDDRRPRTTIAPDPDLGAAWLDGGRMIGLVTLGQLDLRPRSPKRPTLDGDGVLDVDARRRPRPTSACTTDLVPRVTLVGRARGRRPRAGPRDRGDRATSYIGEIELDGVAGLAGGGETDYLPSAGWADVEGQFVILTWGSSSCVPVIEDVAATGPAEVTVTYETPPDDQVCTMDMAPAPRSPPSTTSRRDSDVERDPHRRRVRQRPDPDLRHRTDADVDPDRSAASSTATPAPMHRDAAALCLRRTRHAASGRSLPSM